MAPLFLSWSPCLQVQLLLLTSLWSLVYSLSTRSFVSPLLNALDVFNEATILLIAYATIPFSDYSPDPLLKYHLGWKVLHLFLFNLAFNVLFIVMFTVFSLFRKCRNKQPKHKHKNRKFHLSVTQNVFLNESV